MRFKLAVGTVTAVLLCVIGVDAGAARTAGPAHAPQTEMASTAARLSTANRLPPVSAVATKKLATTAATVVSPAVVDLLVGGADGTATAGTGVVLSPTGQVVTNFHVISGATRIAATDIGTGRTYRASVVGYVLAQDIAVLQLIGATNLPTAHLATAAAEPGQPVVAVGNGGGAGGAPARVLGTVTARNRSVVATDERGESPEALSGMLQTTTPLIPGYSGGPLVNAAGEVVGIDTCATFTVLHQPATAAFAIPIDTMMTAVHAIEALAAAH